MSSPMFHVGVMEEGGFEVLPTPAVAVAAAADRNALARTVASAAAAAKDHSSASQPSTGTTSSPDSSQEETIKSGIARASRVPDEEDEDYDMTQQPCSPEVARKAGLEAVESASEVIKQSHTEEFLRLLNSPNSSNSIILHGASSIDTRSDIPDHFSPPIHALYGASGPLMRTQLHETSVSSGVSHARSTLTRSVSNPEASHSEPSVKEAPRSTSHEPHSSDVSPKIGGSSDSHQSSPTIFQSSSPNRSSTRKVTVGTSQPASAVSKALPRTLASEIDDPLALTFDHDEGVSTSIKSIKPAAPSVRSTSNAVTSHQRPPEPTYRTPDAVALPEASASKEAGSPMDDASDEGDDSQEPLFPSDEDLPSRDEVLKQRGEASETSSLVAGEAAPRSGTPVLASGRSDGAAPSPAAPTHPCEGLVSNPLVGETMLMRVAPAWCLVGTSRIVSGALAATTFRVEFVPDPHEPATWRGPPEEDGGYNYFSLPLGSIARMSREGCVLAIHSRDLRSLTFRFSIPSQASGAENLLRSFAFPLTMALPAEASLSSSSGRSASGGNLANDPPHLRATGRPRSASQSHSASGFPDALANVFAFLHARRLARLAPADPVRAPTSAVRLFRIRTDLERWRLSEANRDHRLSLSYPELSFVPRAFPESRLHLVAGFRAKGRFPALVWSCPPNAANSAGGGSIWRCSQPKVGIGANFSLDDEAYVDAIRSVTPSGEVLLTDCRAYASAVANRARGYGYEDVARYQRARIVFENIANIHALRASYTSFQKLLHRHLTSSSQAAGRIASSWEALDDAPYGASGDNYLADLEATGWLNHLRSILAAGLRLARAVHVGRLAAIVHCSDGWDRTTQVACLACVCLDARFREPIGLMALIKDQWLVYGHKFRDRLGVGADEAVPGEERAPVFMLFLDALHQLVEQFPSYFEYSSRFMEVLSQHLFDCRFGDFLANNWREYEIFVQPHTASVFDYLERELPARPAWRNEAGFDVATRDKVLLPRAVVVCRNVKIWQVLLRASSTPATVVHAFDSNA